MLCKEGVVNSYQACAVGGNSAINAGLYFQPPASDWDNYHPDGWKNADVKAAMDKLLTRQPSVTTYSEDGKYYLQSGYEAAKDWIVNSAGFTEVSFNEEPDNKDRVFGRPVYNYHNGQRGGPATTYLQTALSRSNFHLQTGVRVRYISQAGGVASGVVAEVDGANITIPLSSSGRVVLSTGAVASPGLLMHSGIGPSDMLEKLAAGSSTPYTNSTDWIVNSAVGQGLFDNPNTFIELSGPAISSYSYSYDDPVEEDREQYLSSRSGPYSFGSQTSAFWGYINYDNGTAGIQGTIDSSGHGEYMDNNTITLNIYGTSGMLSAGRVVLSDDKFVPGPDGNVYYTHPRDAEAIATFIHEIFQALPADNSTSGLTPLNIARDATVDEIITYITTPSTYAVGAVQHWSSSCRIGSCVDADTTVLGTTNIHVVDASIVAPLTVNPQFGIMVAAERGAERILALDSSVLSLSVGL